MYNSSGMTHEDITRIEDALFFEPPKTRERVVRFSALIVFSSIIATGGLISDSVAAVIGAMIIAPLMVPIMAIVVGTIMGHPDRAWRSFIVLMVGILMAVTVGFIMGEFMPHGWDVTTSQEVMSRTSPDLLDLVIALAAGGAGAYALSRQDVGDSLPGVAISISLVPPLNATGLLLSGGQLDLAEGSALLFITNMAAIFLAGTIIFFLTGLLQGVNREFRQMRGAFAAIIAFTIFVSIPLGFNTTTFWHDVHREDDAVSVVDAWLDGTEWELYEVTVNGNHVEMVIGGSEELPDNDEVVAELTRIVGDDMELTVRILGVRKEFFQSPGGVSQVRETPVERVIYLRDDT